MALKRRCRRRSAAALGAVAVAVGGMLGAEGAQPGTAPTPADAQPEAREPKSPSPTEQHHAPRRVVVTLTAGDEIAGELVAEDADSVTLRVAGVETRIDRRHIERITPLRSLRERYRAMRAIIDDEDVDRLLILVEWLQNVGLLEEALEELEHILRQAPEREEAQERKIIVERLIELRKREEADAQAEEREDQQRAQRRRRSAALRPGPDVFPLLSDAQVNRIKVYEVDLMDPPALRIERETIETLLQRYAGEEVLPQTREERAVFFAGDPARVLETMFRLRARELYDEVQVLELPESLRRFRDNVHRAWLLNACATTQCHGGLGAGDLVLYTRDRNSQRTALTNFLILERFRTRQGQPLINYDAPEAAPLLQMTLPAATALTPHPAVRGWRPVLQSPRDLRFRQAVEWIRSMHQPRPDYQIDYAPPAPADIARNMDQAQAPARDR